MPGAERDLNETASSMIMSKLQGHNCWKRKLNECPSCYMKT